MTRAESRSSKPMRQNNSARALVDLHHLQLLLLMGPGDSLTMRSLARRPEDFRIEIVFGPQCSSGGGSLLQ